MPVSILVVLITSWMTLVISDLFSDLSVSFRLYIYMLLGVSQTQSLEYTCKCFYVKKPGTKSTRVKKITDYRDQRCTSHVIQRFKGINEAHIRMRQWHYHHRTCSIWWKVGWPQGKNNCLVDKMQPRCFVSSCVLFNGCLFMFISANLFSLWWHQIGCILHWIL